MCSLISQCAPTSVIGPNDSDVQMDAANATPDQPPVGPDSMVIGSDAFEPLDAQLGDRPAMDARLTADVPRTRDAAQSSDGVSMDDGGGPCPPEMVLIANRVCIDRWEAALVQVLAGGATQPWSPYVSPDATRVREVSRADVVPQGYISGAQAAGACREANKRLCTRSEWLAGCQGPRTNTYPFGNMQVMGACNVGRAVHPLVSFYGRNDPSIFTYESMNNPGINQQANSLARTGQYLRCVTDTGLFDMYGNLHEWLDEPDGTFKGGFYADTNTNGPGCLYTTTAHNFTYHDYSTGFRCCADPQ